MAPRLPWDIARDVPWHLLKSPVEQWRDQPSFLVGDRSALGQPVRTGESLGIWTSQLTAFLLPANYRPIPAERVARALLAEVPVAVGKRVLLSGAMNAAA